MNLLHQFSDTDSLHIYIFMVHVFPPQCHGIEIREFCVAGAYSYGFKRLFYKNRTMLPPALVRALAPIPLLAIRHVVNFCHL
jgi:hypothetical protein